MSIHPKPEAILSKLHTHDALAVERFGGFRKLGVPYLGVLIMFPEIRGTLFGGPYNKDPTI